jgi:transcriptional regulator GlxA family with amidase domain
MNTFARKRVGILVFADVEVLDFTGPFEVFSLVRFNEERRWEEMSPFDVVLVAETMDEVRASGGMRVAPDHTIEDCPRLDVLVIPGGWGTRREINNGRLIAWIAEQGRKVETLTSVCTGSLLLGQARLLDGKPATTHYKALDWLRDRFPSVDVHADENVVETDNGRVLTSAGISAGIDMALMVVARHYGEPIARATARFMEYRYPEDNRRHVRTDDSDASNMDRIMRALKPARGD